MTVTLRKMAEDVGDGNGRGGGFADKQPHVPFALMTTAYRRKKLLEGVMTCPASRRCV
jgi:hypothetical protein